MELTEFRISNYRSINNSEWIKTTRITPLVGRNESGKTNILNALYNLNPADGKMTNFNKVKDFPRDRHLSTYQDNLLVVETKWNLIKSEMDEFKSKFSIQKPIGQVYIGRTYKAAYIINIDRLEEKDFIQTAEDSSQKNIKTDIDNWVLSILPKFIYLADYPDLNGHANIEQYIARKANGQNNELDKYFDKLMKVSGLNPQELQALQSQSYELRQQLTNRAGAVVTKKIKELWKDRALKIRFNLDGGHFDTLISDPNASYDVEVNFNERSRGFKWFFSFYITFAADTMDGIAKNAILLLDEPGLYLHAVAQKDLLNHFAKDFTNQILFTTHSPFMIPINSIESIRTVNIETERGTYVNNDPQGDDKTLFPLQAATGYDITQTLFIGDMTLIVEGITDYWYISTISQLLQEKGKKCLERKIVITPAGGATKITYLVSLLVSQNLKIVTLLDAEKTATNAANEMLKSKLLKEDNIIFVNEIDLKISEMDIEDLIDNDVFDKLVKEAYQKELIGKTLALNNSIPRIIHRYEKAFENIGIDFFKTRIAKLFIQKIPSNYSNLLPQVSEEKFERLFDSINKK